LLVDLPVKNLISDSFVTFEFSNTGGVANSCSSEPDLPRGLAVILTSGSCKISGAPTLLQDVITYTIKATNFAGDSTATVGLPITSALILSILVFLNLSSKPLNAATSLPVVICSSVPSTKSILNKSMILLIILTMLLTFIMAPLPRLLVYQEKALPQFFLQILIKSL
jgi:hypothetical protein